MTRTPVRARPVAEKTNNVAAPTRVAVQADDIVCLEAHVGFFRIGFAFLTLTAIVIGPSRWLRGWRVAAFLQWAVLAVWVGLTIALFGFMIPHHRETCCYKPHVSRSLGACDDPHAPIYHERVGHSLVKQACPVFPWRVVVLLVVYVVAICLVCALHAAQMHDVFERYRTLSRSFVALDGVGPQLRDPESRADMAALVLFATDLCSGEAHHIHLTYIMPESLFLAYPLVVYDGWPRVALRAALSLIALFSLLYYYLVYEKLWAAWCCYPQDVPVYDYDNGLCHRGCPEQPAKSYVSLFVGYTCLLLVCVIHFSDWTACKERYVLFETYIFNHSHFKKVSQDTKKSIVQAIKDVNSTQ
jgi:hypothetical protein